jgi:hypothetical protein
MTEHGHPGWYSWLVVVGGCLISVVVSIAVNQQTVSRERAERDAAAERQRVEDERARVISCAFINKINQAYESQRDELSEPGLAVAAAWADLKEQCP